MLVYCIECDNIFRVKQDKLFVNVLRTVETFVLGKSYHPMTKAQIQEKLKLPKQHGPLLQTILKKLVSDSTLKIKEGRYHTTKKSENSVEGIIRVHPRGFGFVIVTGQEDVFIPKQFMQGAADGDTVEVEIDPRPSEKGPEGKIVNIVKRGRRFLTGTLNSKLKNDHYTAYSPLLGKEKRIIITKAPFPLKIGDRLVMEILDWEEDEVICQVKEKLGTIYDPSIDNLAAIKEFDIRSEFSEEAIKEAKAHGKTVKSSPNREDFTDVETFTIDPDTAKDFDDALSLSVDDKGFHLSVHIADVSHYVTPDSALDKEALLRCNSTYFPGFVTPMLPSDLSDNLCSLKEKVRRLCVSVLVDIDNEGNVVHYRIVKSIIKSQKRFTYREALEVIEGRKKSKHKETLLNMVKLTKLLKRKRFERGSVEFSLPEVTLKIDPNGVPTHTDTVYYDITHQLVEEFMLKANELVALHLSNQGKNLTYRIHDTPSEDNLRDFALMADAFGFKLPMKPTQRDIQKLFEEAEATSIGPYLATHYIRRMKMAQYSPQNIGHYGLSLTHYCHFTSPIRRYVDLVAHRLLFGHNDNLTHLDMISSQASEKERISAKAEMSVLTLKKLRYANDKKKENSRKQYEAVITKIRPFGFSFEVLELMLEGFMPLSQLDDYYTYDEKKQSLRGERRKKMFALGDKVTVHLKGVDLIHLEAFWDLVE